MVRFLLTAALSRQGFQVLPAAQQKALFAAFPEVPAAAGVQAAAAGGAGEAVVVGD